jgi:hypothetical protein
MRPGPIAARPTIRAAIDDYDAAVLLGRFIRSVPVFDFRDALGLEPGTVELRMGSDFTEFLVEPRTFEATDAVARDYLPGVFMEQAAKPAPRRALQDGESTTTTTPVAEETTTTTTLPPAETTTTLDPAEDETTTTLANELLTDESTTTLTPEDGTTGELALEPDPEPDAYNLSPILDARPPAGVTC